MTIILSLSAIILTACGLKFGIDMLVFIGLIVFGIASLTLNEI